MTNSLLTEVNCPNCLTPIDIRDHGRHIACPACDSQYLLNGHLCPSCNSYSPVDATTCTDCKTLLKRTCPKCQTENWSGDEYCSECDTAMDVFAIISERHRKAMQLNRDEQRERMRAVKRSEDMKARERMAEMLEEEEARQVALRQRIKAHKQRERKILGLLVFIIGAVIIGLLLYALISAVTG